MLSAATSPELTEQVWTLLVPVGATEQHGPHLPMDTDSRIAGAVADATARAIVARGGGERVVLAPAIAYGASGEHQSFAGTVSIGTAALTTLLVEYGRSATHWCRRIVFVNGHGGNFDAIVSAVGTLRAESRDVAWFACTVDGADLHAGHTETSVMLHVSPEAVRTDNVVPGNRAPLRELLQDMRSGGLAAVSATGVLGDPTTATALEGARIFRMMTNACVDAVCGWNPDRQGRLV